MNPDSKPEAAVQPLRERLRAETVRAITSAAEAVFAAQGLHAARMDDIAARAGVSVGTLYNHFADREALEGAVLDARRGELLAQLDGALGETSGEPFEALLGRFTRTLLDHFETHRPFLSIVLEREQQQQRAYPAGKVNAMREIYERIAALMQRGLRKKALRAAGGDLWAALFMGALRGVLVHSLYEPSKRPLGERAPEVVAFFLHGAGQPAAALRAGAK